MPTCIVCFEPIEEKGAWSIARKKVVTWWEHVPDPNTGRTEDFDHHAEPVIDQ
jgi:hypothetical protein